MRIITIILLFLFYPNLYANEKVVLECFSLTGDYEFKYYGIEQDDLFYINKKRKVTKKTAKGRIYPTSREEESSIINASYQ